MDKPQTEQGGLFANWISLWFIAWQTLLKETSVPLNGAFRKQKITEWQGVAYSFHAACVAPLNFKRSAQDSLKELSRVEQAGPAAHLFKGIQSLFKPLLSTISMNYKNGL